MLTWTHTHTPSWRLPSQPMRGRLLEWDPDFHLVSRFYQRVVDVPTSDATTWSLEACCQHSPGVSEYRQDVCVRLPDPHSQQLSFTHLPGCCCSIPLLLCGNWESLENLQYFGDFSWSCFWLVSWFCATGVSSGIWQPSTNSDDLKNPYIILQHVMQLLIRGTRRENTFNKWTNFCNMIYVYFYILILIL